MIHCPKCGIVPVPEDQLPVVLPLHIPITGEKGSPLAHVAGICKCEMSEMRWACTDVKPTLWILLSIPAGTSFAIVRRMNKMRCSIRTR